MAGILLSKGTAALYRNDLAEAARQARFEYRVLHLPDDPSARLAPGDCAQVEIAYYTRDIRFSPFNDAFVEALAAAPGLKWVHFVTAAIEHFPFVTALLERGVKLTHSAGSNGEPVAQTAICGPAPPTNAGTCGRASTVRRLRFAPPARHSSRPNG